MDNNIPNIQDALPIEEHAPKDIVKRAHKYAHTQWDHNSQYFRWRACMRSYAKGAWEERLNNQ